MRERPDGLVEVVARALNLEAGRQRGLTFEDDWDTLTEQERGGWRLCARVALDAAHDAERAVPVQTLRRWAKEQMSAVSAREPTTTTTEGLSKLIGQVQVLDALTVLLDEHDRAEA